MSTVLVVDDDAEITQMVGDLLRSEGYDVTTANSGEQALRVLKDNQLPEVLVLDVDMPPGMNGPQVAHQMLLHDSGQENIPVVLLSANQDLPAIARRMGTPYAMRKPGDADELVRLVERARRERVAPRSA